MKQTTTKTRIDRYLEFFSQLPEKGSCEPVCRDAMNTLAHLDAMTPLVRDDTAVEALVIEQFRGNWYLSVKNLIGACEVVTVFLPTRAYAESFEDWCRCREESLDGDDAWDLARRERRVVPDGPREMTLIDGGINLPMDIITQAGCVTHYSCEGHPNGGYLVFTGPASAAVADCFRQEGWRVESPADREIVRMPVVAHVHERDARWRSLCVRMAREFDIDISVQPAASVFPTP